MAQYDVHALKAGHGLVVDVQSDLLDPLNTRIVVPLLPRADAPTPLRRLNPILEVGGAPHVFMAQYLAAIRASELGAPIGDLAQERDAITAALDMAFQGF